MFARLIQNASQPYSLRISTNKAKLTNSVHAMPCYFPLPFKKKLKSNRLNFHVHFCFRPSFAVSSRCKGNPLNPALNLKIIKIICTQNNIHFKTKYVLFTTADKKHETKSTSTVPQLLFSTRTRIADINTSKPSAIFDKISSYQSYWLDR